MFNRFNSKCYLIVKLIISFNLFSMAPAWAEPINIHISQGVSGEIPIYIAPFEGDGAVLTDVIKNDLAVSGRFKIVASNHKNLENALAGSIKNMGGGQYQISFELKDLYNPSAQRLSAKIYDKVQSKDFRRLAHQISNVIYETLTGTKGIFATRIAYVLVDYKHQYPYALQIADWEGGHARTILSSKEPIMSPAWSPDGKYLAYVSFEKKRSEIYSIEVATGKRNLLSRFSGINGAPSFSPDGRTMALALSKDGSLNLYTMDLATKALKQITRGSSMDTEPVFDPSGRFLLFTSNRGGAAQIYKVFLDSLKVQRVSFAGAYNARPRITPNGKNMIMLHRKEGYKIATQNLQTGVVRVLTRSRSDSSPSVSPNGEIILYSTSHGPREVLAMVTLDGRVCLELPAKKGNVQEPAWSPYL